MVWDTFITPTARDAIGTAAALVSVAVTAIGLTWLIVRLSGNVPPFRKTALSLLGMAAGMACASGLVHVIGSSNEDFNFTFPQFVALVVGSFVAFSPPSTTSTVLGLHTTGARALCAGIALAGIAGLWLIVGWDTDLSVAVSAATAASSIGIADVIVGRVAAGSGTL